MISLRQAELAELRQELAVRWPWFAMLRACFVLAILVHESAIPAVKRAVTRVSPILFALTVAACAACRCSSTRTFARSLRKRSRV